MPVKLSIRYKGVKEPTSYERVIAMNFSANDPTHCYVQQYVNGEILDALQIDVRKIESVTIDGFQKLA